MFLQFINGELVESNIPVPQNLSVKGSKESQHKVQLASHLVGKAKGEAVKLLLASLSRVTGYSPVSTNPFLSSFQAGDDMSKALNYSHLHRPWFPADAGLSWLLALISTKASLGKF